MMLAEIDNETDADIYETYYINKYNPIYNVRKKYGCESKLALPELKFTKILKDSFIKQHKFINKHVSNFDQEKLLIFLNNKAGKYLSDNEKNELINLCDYYKNGRQKRSVSKINEFIMQYGFSVESIRLYEKHNYKKHSWKIQQLTA